MYNQFKTLDLHKYFYDYFLRTKILEVQESLAGHELLKRVSFLANFAWRNHPGYYSDGRLENRVFEYGKDLESHIDSSNVVKKLGGYLLNGQSGYSVVHVATTLFGAGGHTRALYQFIKRYEDARQIVLLTGQAVEKVPEWFAEGIGNVPLVSLHNVESLFERAWLLRQVSRNARSVVLHHHPDDVVPVMAYADHDAPPVLLLDHAHSWFWLGASVADLVLAPSELHKQFALASRPVKNVSHFPFTQLDDLDTGFAPQDKLAARKRLGLSPDAVCVMTIGTPEKFIPNTRYNFYHTAHTILQRFKQVELFVVGVTDSSAIREKYQLHSPRIHFCGFVDNPEEYYKAADICLDALPQPSLGATLYAALIGLACPMFKYGASHMFNGRNFIESPLYSAYIGTAETEKEYLDTLAFLIANPAVRIQIAEEIRAGFKQLACKKSLLKTIQKVLEQADTLLHTPHSIPAGRYMRDADSAEIAEAGGLQDIRSIMGYFDCYLNRSEKIAILAQLATNPSYTRDVIQLTKKLLKSKLPVFDTYFKGTRRFYGSPDSVLSAPVSSHTGK